MTAQKKILEVKKRNGTLEGFDADKINKILIWATTGIHGVSASDIAMNAELQFYSGISTIDIHKVLIHSAVNLISDKNPNYQYVASRLSNYLLRKEVFEVRQEMPDLLDVITKNTSLKVYDPIILKKYTEEEIHEINKFIHHNRDENFTYAGLQQLIDKYLVKDRIHNKVFETPQFAFILIAMTVFADYKSNRLNHIKILYDMLSQHKISLPTPIIAGIRTSSKQFSSCTLIEIADSLDSLFTGNTAVGQYVAKRAGIGINLGSIRALGSKVRNGEIVHTGVIPFLKMFQSTLLSCSQGGIRKGSATVYFPWWHKEIEDILVLKNNKGTDDNRVNKIDYAIQFEKLFYTRFIKNENISLFSSSDVPGLYDVFGTSQFEALYKKYEQDKTIPRKTVKARELMDKFSEERIGTGRMYVHNIDHTNTNSPFIQRLTMSNLCVAPETKLLTSKGYKQIQTLEGQEVEVWNGKNLSKTKVEKTGTNQKLIHLEFSNGQSLDCTPYHKFYTQTGYSGCRGKDKPIIEEKRAIDLKPNDKIIKYSYPTIEFENIDFKSPYTQGFFSGDGCTYRNKNHIDLYGVKHKLLSYIDHHKEDTYWEKQDRTRIHIDPSFVKFEVPSEYSIETKLRWLEGLLDADGCLCKNGNTEHLQVSSINIDFILDVQLMLSTMGVEAKVTNASEAAYKPLPDSNRESKLYYCKKIKRLLISANGVKQLKSLGFSPKRLLLSDHQPNRNASKFIKVTKIEDLGRIDDTFCVNEPEQHKVVFNGILTGNCVEIVLPTAPIESLADIDSSEETEKHSTGEIALCTLAAFNLGTINISEMERIAEYVLRVLDFVIDNQDYPVNAAKKMIKRRSVGVGVTNFAYWMAKNGLKYSDDSSLNAVDSLFESIQYYLLKASVKLSKERGKCEWFDQTTYSQGVLPIDRYNKNVDQLVQRQYTYDWEELRQEIKQYGLRNSTLTAIMPSESSSLVQNATNGIEPVRSLVVTKGSKSTPLKVVAPEVQKLKNKYELAFDMPDNKGYTNICAVIQKWIDQTISANHYYHYSAEGIDIEQVNKDILYSYKMGLKTLYYANTNDKKTDNLDLMGETQESGCESGACSI